MLVDGRWLPGDLEAFQQGRDGTWRGWVRWSTGVGQNHLDWFAVDKVRKVT